MVGVTVMDVPFPDEVPPQETVYHFHVDPPVPILPTTDNVVDEPLHIVVVPVIDVGAVASVFTVTVVCAQLVGIVLHPPSALT